MASGVPPPRNKKSRQPAPTSTTILALGDDLLLEVFLRLPSLPSLVRAALACPAFLSAVRSSTSFRRRFRDLHPPPILGAFLVTHHDHALPTFAPILLRGRGFDDPDHAAALRGFDAFLTRLPDVLGDGEDEWSISGCRDGYVVLVTPRWNTKKVAVYDPLRGALHLFSAPPDEILLGESEFHVISSEADDGSFRLLCVRKDNGGAQVAVLSPDSREWQFATIGESFQDASNGTKVNGCIYWASEPGRDHIPVLDTAKLKFSRIGLPTGHGPDFYDAGETNDGKLCLVRVSPQLDVHVWVRRAGDDGVDKWMHDMTFHMLDAIDKLALNTVEECPRLVVAAIIGGTVYLWTDQEEPPNWLLSFSLETRELKKLCQVTRDDSCYPYIMAWPPSLVRNKARADQSINSQNK